MGNLIRILGHQSTICFYLCRALLINSVGLISTERCIIKIIYFAQKSLKLHSNEITLLLEKWWKVLAQNIHSSVIRFQIIKKKKRRKRKEKKNCLTLSRKTVNTFLTR